MPPSPFSSPLHHHHPHVTTAAMPPPPSIHPHGILIPVSEAQFITVPTVTTASMAATISTEAETANQSTSSPSPHPDIYVKHAYFNTRLIEKVKSIVFSSKEWEKAVLANELCHV
ncbi:hypothetical protein Tco_1021812 [Tanacetum coccineum]